MNTYKIDWVAATMPQKMTTAFTLQTYVSQALHIWQGAWGRVRGANGYKLALEHLETKAVVRSNGNDDMGTRIVLSGTALNELSKTQQLTDIVQRLCTLSGKITRLDLAIDVIGDARADIPRLHDLYLAQQCSTKSKTPPTLIRSGLDGYTLYVGSRTSERFMRIYNKQAERRANGEHVDYQWVRIELELKGERAANCAKTIAASGNNIADVICAHIGDFISFDEAWWKEALTGKAIELQQSTRKLTDTETWLLEQVAPAFARQLLKDDKFHLRFMDAVRACAERETERQI